MWVMWRHLKAWELFRINNRHMKKKNWRPGYAFFASCVGFSKQVASRNPWDKSRYEEISGGSPYKIRRESYQKLLSLYVSAQLRKPESQALGLSGISMNRPGMIWVVWDSGYTRTYYNIQ